MSLPVAELGSNNLVYRAIEFILRIAAHAVNMLGLKMSPLFLYQLLEISLASAWAKFKCMVHQ